MSVIERKEDIIDILAPVFEKNGSNKAILFGSFAKDEQHDNSDIDILVDSGLRGLAFFGLLEDVCSTLDRPVDLIDTQDLQKGSPMEKEIERTGILIYERQRF